MRVVIQKNISVIRSYSFAGCSSLAEIVLVQNSPSSCPVTHFTFDSVSPVIYVPKGCLAAFVNDYTWSYYGELIREAEE